MTTKKKWRSGARTLLLIAVATHAPAVLHGQSMPRPLAPTGAALTAIAAPVDQAPRIDGVLDEAFWETIPPITDFRQRVPVDGDFPTERTEVRIAFDSDAIYFGFRLFDSHPDLIRRSILQREGRIDEDDHIWIGLDTYHDGRNAYIFELNSFGTQGDALITDESMTLSDWNWEGVYRSEARVTDEGWTLEVAIPFTTIRFEDAEAPEMGVAIRRAIRRKNEEVFWPHIPQRYRAGFNQVSQYATLSGLQDVRRGRYMELKPFAILGGQKLSENPDTDVVDDIGVDFKYAITSNLTADLTWNTDFAQVESDNVQVNLTRFSLFFPEKREFFLERAGLFSFGEARQTEIFFSRRIGLINEIRGGGRMTGQVGPLSVGALSLQTGDLDTGTEILPGSNNSVVRFRGEVFPRTTVGGMFTSLQNGVGHNRVFGADTQVRFWGSSTFEGWLANVDDSGTGSSSAGSLKIDVRPQRWYSVGGGFQSIDAGFNPGLGFVRRTDMVKYSGSAAWTPRFESNSWARSLVAALLVDRVDGQDGVQQGSSQLMHNMFSLESGDVVMLNVRRRFERLAADDFIQGRALPAGDYEFSSVDAIVSTNTSRTVSGRANVTLGNFWNGTRTTYGGSLKWKTGPYLTLTPAVSRNDIDLPVTGGQFSTTVTSLNVLGAVSRDLFANALVQWDDVSKALQANIRIDWIHAPGSDLFVVFNTGYQTGVLLDPRDTRWLQRTGVVKLTYLKAF
jgi:hypothetical protein